MDDEAAGEGRCQLRLHPPLLQQGTVILFDDWNAFTARASHGERAATREWLAANLRISLESYAKYGWHGEAFIVHIAE